MEKKTVRWFAVVGSLYFCFFLCDCKKDSQTKAPQSKPSVQVTLFFEVFNHTQGFLTSFERMAETGTEEAVKISELDVEGVDENRIVIRENRLGTRVGFGQDGVASFEAPDEDKNFTIYLMNASNGADYKKVDTWVNTNEGILEYAPHVNWYREDRNDFQGPEDVIQDAIAQMNEALAYPWAIYGSFQRIDQRKNSSFGLGYGYCRNQFGWHNPYWAGVNPDHCPTYKTKLETFLEEIFELVTRLNDIGGKDTASLITDPDTGNLNELGKDLLAYVFIKDDKI